MFAIGTTLAIVQPGDLGDDDVTASATTSTTIAADTTTTTAAISTTTTDAAITTTTAAGATTTTLGSTTTSIGTSTTVASGLGGVGSGNVNPDDVVADTGGESMIGLGMALLGLGFVARRFLRPRTI